MMKRIVEIMAVCVLAVPVVGAVVVGAMWLRTELPHAEVAREEVPPHVSYAPRQAVIPWMRDPDAIGVIAAGPAWLPWEKVPRGARPTAGGAVVPASLVRGHIDPSEISDITRELDSGDATKRADAVNRIDALLVADPTIVSQQLRGPGLPWVRAFFAAKDFDALDGLLEKLVIALPYDTGALENVMNLRAKVAMAENRPDAALVRCRQWFAISTLYGSAPAIAAAEQALISRHASKAEIRSFRASLADAAATTTSSPATQGDTIMHLSPDSPDADRFLAAARSLNDEDYGALTARGNLYLLAGRPDEAERVFRRAYMLAGNGQLVVAGENLARCVKARTGTIAAANHFVMERR